MGLRGLGSPAHRRRGAIVAAALAWAVLQAAAAPVASASSGVGQASAPVSLAVTLAGAGAGTVTSTPVGIDCGATCTATFDPDTAVVLSASPATGSAFKGWSGACTGTDPCSVTMTGDVAVTATFDDTAPPAVHVTIDGGIPTTGDRTLALTIAATDNVPGPLSMRVGVAATGSAITLGDPQPYAATVGLQLAAGSPSGSFTVLVEVADASSNTAQAAASIVYVIPDGVTARLVPSYRLAAALDYAGGSLTVTETITVTNGSDAAVQSLNLSVLAHAYGELRLNGPVTVNGHAVTPTWPNSAELRVPLSNALQPGHAATVVVPFVATAKTDVSDSLRARFSKVVDAKGVVMMQVSSWYPLLSTDHALRNPGDSQFSVAARVTMTLDYPSKIVVAGVAKALRLAAPGVVSIAASSIAGHSVATVRLSGARELAFGVSPRFLASTATTTHLSSLGHPITVTAYYLSGESGATAAANARKVLDSLIAAYGPYPYDRFVIGQAARSASGNEYSGIVFLGGPILGSLYSVSHEVAHQWFYHLVGDDQLVGPWLDEGFAEYVGRSTAGIAMPTYCSSLPVDDTVYAFPNKPATTTCDGYVQTIYYKSCHLLAGIRSRLGATAFTAALRDLVSTYRGKVVDEAEVVAIFERHSSNPAALDAFLYAGYLTRPPA